LETTPRNLPLGLPLGNCVPMEFHSDKTLLTSHETLAISLFATSAYLMQWNSSWNSTETYCKIMRTVVSWKKQKKPKENGWKNKRNWKKTGKACMLTTYSSTCLDSDSTESNYETFLSSCAFTHLTITNWRFLLRPPRDATRIFSGQSEKIEKSYKFL
jgi:hypothetical protein